MVSLLQMFWWRQVRMTESRTGDQCRQPQLGPVFGEDVTIKLTFGQWRRHDEDLGLVSGHCFRMEIQEYDSRLKRGWEVLGKRPLIVIPKYSYLGTLLTYSIGFAPALAPTRTPAPRLSARVKALSILSKDATFLVEVFNASLIALFYFP